jgi:hypothetical protein
VREEVRVPVRIIAPRLRRPPCARHRTLTRKPPLFSTCASWAPVVPIRCAGSDLAAHFVLNAYALRRTSTSTTVRRSLISALSPHAIVHACLITRAHTVSCANVHTLTPSLPLNVHKHTRRYVPPSFASARGTPNMDSFTRSTERAFATAICTWRSARSSSTLHAWLTIITNTLFSSVHVERTHSTA